MQQSTQYLILELAQLLCFPIDICHRWCKLNFEHLHGSSELQDKSCKQQVYFSCCLAILTTAVPHEVKSSNYRCRNLIHQTYYSSPCWNHIWQSRSALSLCKIICIFLRKYIWQSPSFKKVATLNTVTSLTVNSITDIFLQISQHIQNTAAF